MATRLPLLIDRDFYGYGASLPRIAWPNNARLALSFVLNLEEGAEFSLRSGDPSNEDTHEVQCQIKGAPDLCMESHFEYGTRVGYWRVMSAFEEAGVPVTLNVCARALEATPWVADYARQRGDELCCHGWRWESHAGMSEPEERALIDRCVATFQQIAGNAPVGWHTKSSPSLQTRRLLIEHGGFLYDSDAYNDDLPYYVTHGERAHLVLPYAFDTNDMRFFVNHSFHRARDFHDYVMDAVKALLREGEQAPRMLTIGLHTRIIGRPGRIDGLRELFASLQGLPVWYATREQIAQHWLRHCPPPSPFEAGVST
ncbi:MULTISPECIES: polysaccharide deacetylase family protein [unclassified Halomonas]|uniref:polysaccharide deacetylase family protein n=1 Tax=unclassified Halomonas TaxID=2609666 RepID=UPI001CF1C644|nr:MULTISPECIES: polysaccharide deacetylase family protein [unclassified Halomonas]MCA8862703.1 polysaccharide deacetylase family protein [Halomonas sp. SBBP1]UZH09791.1 polysaccharide deacetylase family protein [Halomonas sp. BDJS001]